MNNLQGQNNPNLSGQGNPNSPLSNNIVLELLLRLSEENRQKGEQLTKHEQIISDYKTQLQNSNEEISKLKKDIEKTIKRDIEEMKSDIKNTRDKTLEPLAVFVGLFTFVSVGFNIFANVKDTTLWISLLLIIAGIVIIFSSLVIHAGSLATKENNRRKWTAALVAVGLLITVAGTVIHICNPDTLTENGRSQMTTEKKLEDNNLVE